MIEAEKDAGGHAMLSGGTIPLGGGTSAQKNTVSRIHRTYCAGISPIGQSSKRMAQLTIATTIGK